MRLIAAKFALPMNGTDCIPNGTIAVGEQGNIEAVGPLENLKKEFPQASLEEFPDSVLMPGLVNAHCHLDRAGFYSRYSVETPASLSPTAWFIESLQYLSTTTSNAVSTMMDKSIDRQIDLGTTCIGSMNHYEGAFPILKAKGIRGVNFVEIFSAPTKEAQTRFEIALALIEKYHDDNGLMQMGLGPFAPYVLSKNLLNIIAQHARDRKLPIQIHVAETFAEMEFFFDSKGPIAEEIFPWLGWEDLPPPHQKTPIQYLEEIGFMKTSFSAVGAYHLSASDIPRLVRGKTKVVYCPTSRKRLNLGDFPWKRFKEGEIPVAIGTDLYSDADGFNVWEEMRLILKENTNALPTATEVLKMGTYNGSAALGLKDRTGSLEAGKSADYILVQCPELKKYETESLCRGLIEQTGAGQINRVVVAGKTFRGK